MPTDLSSYREIFRKEDGDQRILFSYQDNGAILSLGLNINGYVEFDAKIDPRQVQAADARRDAGAPKLRYPQIPHMV